MDTYSMEMIQCLIFPFENTLSQALEVFFIALLEQVNMDQAFTRRFQSLVHFPMPDKNQRLNLWEQILRGSLKPGPECDLASLADEYELSGR